MILHHLRKKRLMIIELEVSHSKINPTRSLNDFSLRSSVSLNYSTIFHRYQLSFTKVKDEKYI